MAVFHVWFPLLPDSDISASERMGLLTGIRKASEALPFYTDKFSSQGTSYSDKYSNRGTSYSDKYSQRNL